ncbi:MAG: hypothetical protein PVJ39_20850 [Gammaproteobacteria bacterium]|jgi:hypothetical protein
MDNKIEHITELETTGQSVTERCNKDADIPLTDIELRFDPGPKKRATCPLFTIKRISTISPRAMLLQRFGTIRYRREQQDL